LIVSEEQEQSGSQFVTFTGFETSSHAHGLAIARAIGRRLAPSVDDGHGPRFRAAALAGHSCAARDERDDYGY
jgi:hypothetical protein